jgi:hypothetical protein
MDDISKGLDFKLKKSEKMTDEERRQAFFKKM